jgi:hypothetical protein
MKEKPVARQIRVIKASIMSGQAEKAAKDVENLMHLLRRHPPERDEIEGLEAALAELRFLADAALLGARSAADHLRTLLQTARLLETYDNLGQRKITDTAPPQTRRY